MAIITQSSLIGAISGNVGGVNFATGKGTSYVRKRKVSIKKNTVAQTTAKNTMQVVRLGWQNLLEVSRQAFNRMAEGIPHTNRLGQTSRLTGFQLYVQINIPDPIIGITPQYVGPPQSTLKSVPIVDADISFEVGGPYTFKINPDDHPLGSWVNLYVSRPMTKNAITHFKFWRHAGKKQNLVANYDWQSKIEPVVGELIEGEVVGLQAFHTEPFIMPSLLWSGQTTVIP